MDGGLIARWLPEGFECVSDWVDPRGFATVGYRTAGLTVRTQVIRRLASTETAKWPHLMSGQKAARMGTCGVPCCAYVARAASDTYPTDPVNLQDASGQTPSSDFWSPGVWAACLKRGCLAIFSVSWMALEFTRAKHGGAPGMRNTVRRFIWRSMLTISQDRRIAEAMGELPELGQVGGHARSTRMMIESHARSLCGRVHG